jgi:hypothetical protein
MHGTPAVSVDNGGNVIFPEPFKLLLLPTLSTKRDSAGDDPADDGGEGDRAESDNEIELMVVGSRSVAIGRMGGDILRFRLAATAEVDFLGRFDSAGSFSCRVSS